MRRTITIEQRNKALRECYFSNNLYELGFVECAHDEGEELSYLKTIDFGEQLKQQIVVSTTLSYAHDWDRDPKNFKIQLRLGIGDLQYDHGIRTRYYKPGSKSIRDAAMDIVETVTNMLRTKRDKGFYNETVERLLQDFFPDAQAIKKAQDYNWVLKFSSLCGEHGAVLQIIFNSDGLNVVRVSFYDDSENTGYVSLMAASKLFEVVKEKVDSAMKKFDERNRNL